MLMSVTIENFQQQQKKAHLHNERCKRIKQVRRLRSWLRRNSANFTHRVRCADLSSERALLANYTFFSSAVF